MLHAFPSYLMAVMQQKNYMVSGIEWMRGEGERSTSWINHFEVAAIAEDIHHRSLIHWAHIDVVNIEDVVKRSKTLKPRLFQLNRSETVMEGHINRSRGCVIIFSSIFIFTYNNNKLYTCYCFSLLSMAFENSVNINYSYSRGYRGTKES